MEVTEVNLSLSGKEHLSFGGYSYGKKNVRRYKIRWKCIESTRNKCKGAVTTSSSVPYTDLCNFKPHSHPPDELTTKVQQLRLELRKRAACCTANPKDVMNSFLHDVPLELRDKLGKLSTVKRDIRRRRQLATMSSAHNNSDSLKQDNQYSVMVKEEVGDSDLEECSAFNPENEKVEEAMITGNTTTPENTSEQMTSDDDVEPSPSEEDHDSSRYENQNSGTPEQIQNIAVDFQMYPKASSPFKLISGNTPPDRISNRLMLDLRNTEKPTEAVSEVLSSMLQSVTVRMCERGSESTKQDFKTDSVLPEDLPTYPIQSSCIAPAVAAVKPALFNDNGPATESTGNVHSQQQTPQNHSTPPKQVDSEKESSLSSLHAAISRLESLSGKLEAAIFEDGLDKFGKNLVSLLRGLPWETIQSLQKKFTVEILHAKSLYESSKKRDSRPDLLPESINNITTVMTRTTEAKLKPGRSNNTNKRKQEKSFEHPSFKPAAPCHVAASNQLGSDHNFTGLESGLVEENLPALDNGLQHDVEEEPEMAECKFEMVLCDGMVEVKEEPGSEESSTNRAAEEVSLAVPANTDINTLGFRCSLCNAHCYSVIHLKQHYSQEHLCTRSFLKTKTTEEPEDNAKRKCAGLSSINSSVPSTHSLKLASEAQSTRIKPL